MKTKFNLQFTKEQATSMLKDYWVNNGFDETYVNDYDVKDIMCGDLMRLMIDPHKYDDCE